MKFHTVLTRRLRINRAVRELRGLNDEMLRDIGIDRADISRVAETLIDAPVNAAHAARTAGDTRKPWIMRAAGRAPA